MERKISSHLRRWLGLPRSLSSAALYGSSNTLKLPFSGLTEEFMVTRTREALQYRESRDEKVASAGIQVRTGRKWRAVEALEVAESRLRQKVLVGSIASGRAGIGYFPSTRVDKAQGKQRQHLIQEEERASRMVGMGQQGAWTKWENVLQRKITWPNIWRADSLNIRLLVQAVYDVLPSPSNLHVWGKAETPSCLQCPGGGSLEHLLSSCPKALGEGRYRWRHDQVLKAVAESIAKAITTTKNYSKPQSIRFHRAGEKPTIQARARSGLLTTATDWQLEVDLGKQLKIPARITTTRLRPDMIIVSDSTKQLIILELTVPWEERMEEANERKRAKYQELVEECRSQGWRTYCEPLEVGCRGFAGRSLCKVLTMLGLTGEAKRKAIRSATEAAERATRWLWIKRADPWKNAAGTQAGV
ncbi:uncharacterized protein LOC121684601 [Alosa sapidissima]|uniref:uncharacterized protein LOC121684601 n=1 Tax=Alosa sapidissima TaxID=34773 RepID=UPI001C09A370|nr:uncharacterized protein LOC121684601 [Alosa sapidissima]